MRLCYKTLLPLLLLLMVIMIPQAFAADNATEVTSVAETQAVNVDADYDNVEASPENEGSDAIYVSTDGDDNNNGSQSSPYATIYRAVNEAQDSGISDIYILEGTYEENSIPIETSLNIKGIGNVVVDAQGIDRIFKIDGPYDVTLSGLTLINGVAPTDEWTADIHEVVWYASGGAIFIKDAYVIIDNMTFINNSANDFGGAVNVEVNGVNTATEYCIIRNSVFMNNYAGVFGGAIDFEMNNGTVDNCTFINNEAGNGGAIGYIASAGTIINSLFENNTAENGAAIFIENGPLTFDGSNQHLIQNNKFIHNEAVQQGGAIEVENQQMSENADWTLIDGNEFIDNYGYNGGAISAYYGDAGITNNLFKNNSAGYGGAIAAISTTDSPWIVIGGIYLKNNTIIDCIAEENGNAIYNMGYFGTTINITFIEGKTIYSNDGKAVILNVTVYDDMGNPISGSPIDFTVDGKPTINPASDLTEGFGTVRFVPRENGTFVVSGVLNNKKFNVDKINLITGKIVVENAIADYFGTIHVSESEGDDDNTGAEDSPVQSFNQAYVLATRDGGSFNIVVNEGKYYVPGYEIHQSLNITGIGNPTLDGKNQATLFSLYGAPDDEFHFTGLKFINGVADPSKYAGMNEGGAIFFKGGNLYLDNDSFSYNSAKDYGGAVHINKGMDDGGDFYRAFAYINNCTFKNNLAEYFGGAISLYDSDVFVTNSNFESNTANKRGGAISILNGMGNLTVINSSFYKNTASYSGGAIEADALYTFNIRYYADIFNSTFRENIADYGGAIVAGDANITQCVFIKNTAKICGGAVLTNETFLGEPKVNQSSISYCIFESNNAPEGSAYYGTAVLVNNNFWGKNYNSVDELIEDNSIFFVPKEYTLSWVNVEISGPSEVLVGQYEYLIRFVSNDGNELESNLPDYNIKLSNKISENKLSTNNVLLSGNIGKFMYNATKFGEDTINAIVSYNVSVLEKKNTYLTVENKSFLVSEQKLISAVLKDKNGVALSNKTLVFNIDGTNYTEITDAEGIAALNLNLTELKSYDINVFFAGDEKFEAADAKASVEVYKIKTNITSPNRTFLVTKSNTVTATLSDVDGNLLANKTVTFTINGRTYTKTTNDKGQASLKLPTLAVKSYKLTVIFNGDDKYLGDSKVATIKITKEKAKITAPKKTFKKSAKTKKVVITLKSNSGKVISKKKVTLKVNGKTYSAKTNSKGKATFKVKLTAKKTFKYTVNFKGDSKFSAVTKKSTIKIK